MSKYKTIREQAYEANMQLPELGLVLFTFGNASCADRNASVFAIKPSGVPYRELKASAMVIVDFDGHLVDGSLRASSDTATHAALYKEWDGIGGIVHTHSSYATAWAQTGRSIPILGTTHADHLYTDIPCAPVMADAKIEGEYEHETAWQIIDHFNKLQLDYQQVEMVLVSRHAPFSWATTVEKAVYNSAILEELAKMAFVSLSIEPDLTRLKNSLIDKHYKRKHGPNAYYGQKSS